MNNKLTTFMMVFGLVLISLVGLFIIFYYFNSTLDSCMADPFAYGAKNLENNINEQVFGTIIILNHPEIKIYFDSEKTTIENTKKSPFLMNLSELNNNS